MPRHDELKNPACPIRPVRKIAVIARGNAEHPDHIQSQAQPNSLPRDSREEGGQTNQVNSEERQAFDPIDADASSTSGWVSFVTATVLMKLLNTTWQSKWQG